MKVQNALHPSLEILQSIRIATLSSRSFPIVLSSFSTFNQRLCAFSVDDRLLTQLRMGLGARWDEIVGEVKGGRESERNLCN